MKKASSLKIEGKLLCYLELYYISNIDRQICYRCIKFIKKIWQRLIFSIRYAIIY